MTPGGDGRTALALVGSALCIVLAAGSADAQCVGDCDGNDAVAVNELVLGVNISLGMQAIDVCPAFDCQGNGTVPINCLVQGVNNSLEGCGEPCPLAAGRYTLTQVEGGSLRVSSLSAIPFPVGGKIVLDVDNASAPSCEHDVVVPSPGGLDIPAFCINAFGFSVKLTQTGCGIGRVDSNRGADYSVTAVGDTSSQPECNNQQQMCVNAVDNKVRADVTVGDDTPDACPDGSANVLFSVPVEIVVWVENSTPASCPAGDGTFNPENEDTLILRVEQIFDLTTDTSMASWMDSSGDGCTIAGAGPPSLPLSTGACWDIAAQTIGVAASGTVGSASPPLHDFTFAATLLNSVSTPEPPQGATCDSPPAIDFTGTAIRCLE